MREIPALVRQRKGIRINVYVCTCFCAATDFSCSSIRMRVEKMLDGNLEELALILFGAFLLCFFYNFLSTFLKNLRETQSKVLRHDDDGEEEEHKTLLKPLDGKV